MRSDAANVEDSLTEVPPERLAAIGTVRSVVNANLGERWKAGGREADFGKACIRFRKIEDLDLDLIAETIRGVSAAEFVRHYEETLRGRHRP